MASVTFRLPEAEREEWQRQANLAGVSLSEWIRERCASADGHNQSVRGNGSAGVAERSTGARDRIAASPRGPEASPEPDELDKVIAEVVRSEKVPTVSVPTQAKRACLHGKKRGENCW